MIKWTIENTGLHIDRIVSVTQCAKHAADISNPCWTIYSINGPLRAVCDRRAREAGATGKITPYKK